MTNQDDYVQPEEGDVIQETAYTRISPPPLTPGRQVLQLAGMQVIGDLAPLFASLAKAQKNYSPIERTREVEVTTLKGDKYKFQYAPHEQVIAATRDALNAEGLSITSFNPVTVEPVIGADGVPSYDQDGYPMQLVREHLHTILGHESGACIVMSVDMGVSDSPQKYGSKLTYSRRYTEGCITASAAEYDDDGNHASGNTVQNAKDRAPRGGQQRADSKPATAPGQEKATVLGSLIKEETLRLGMAKGPRAGIICMEVTGKEPKDLNDEDRQKLLAHLRGLETPKQQ